MRALIVYESMYGNTHAVAEGIATGLRTLDAEVRTVPVGEASRSLVDCADLLVVGGPTHAHVMTSKTSRAQAREAARKPDSGLQLDPDAEGPSLRDWFGAIGDLGGKASAAFDTRIDAPAILTGRASRGISRRLHEAGALSFVEPESFLVDRRSALVEGEDERAAGWGPASRDHCRWPCGEAARRSPGRQGI
jgi:hypothetical protein